MLTRDTNTAAHKTRARHVTPSPTRERQDRICSLIAALQLRQMTRDEIGSLLCVGPSGVRKYLTDLRGMVSLSSERGEQVCRWTASADETQAYLAKLGAQAARPARVRTALSMAMRDPGRHFHVMADDAHFPIRPHRGVVVRDVLVAALFGSGHMEASCG